MWFALGFRFLALAALGLFSAQLGDRRYPAVPLENIFALLLADLLLVFVLRAEGLSFSLNRVLLVGLILMGFLLLGGSYRGRRWYILKTGGFDSSLDPLYEEVGRLLRNHLWLENLPPASVVLYTDGRIGFQNLNKKEREAILERLAEKFAEDRELKEHLNWRRFLWIHFWCVLAIMIATF